ncbi:MAG: N-acetyltransferase [Propionibacteriaceae bacterium]|jgi:predicted GNAT family acetyltransferase|nr:N-acetyltransferase [Propionibacteriaceae bacterium]
MALTVTCQPAVGRYLAWLDEKPAGYLEYHLRGDDLAFVHTIVEADCEGQGVGSALVAAALDGARADGHGVLPYCPFVRAYLLKHPSQLGLVPARRRLDFGLPADLGHPSEPPVSG